MKQNAKDVLTLLERGTYEVDGDSVSILDAQATAVKNSELFTPDQVADLRLAALPGAPTIEVIGGTTQLAAQALAPEVMLLNFASARNPGGGFLNGAKAQEEDLCRCSGLFPSLLQHPAYYKANRAQRSLIYTDHAIYTPRVPFFKVRGNGPQIRPFLASVLTMPAPNSGPYLRKHPDDHATLAAAFERRWSNVFAIAQDRAHRCLLLGAWGCGAFGGDPELVAKTAKRALAKHGGAFDKVVFAIPERGKQSLRNLHVFQEILGS